MKNFRNQLRKGATIIACLAVTTMFAACDKKNGDDDDGNGGGNLDKALFGEGIDWRHENTATGAWNAYKFNANGTFEYYRAYNGYGTEATGSYRTSEGKIYFSKIDYATEKNDGELGKITEEKKINEIVFEYQVGKDNNGNYLMIPLMYDAARDDEFSLDISKAIRFKRQNNGRYD